MLVGVGLKETKIDAGTLGTLGLGFNHRVSGHLLPSHSSPSSIVEFLSIDSHSAMPPRTLIVDIWLLIIDMLDQPSLKAVAEVSKTLHILSMPALYAKIDMSIHHTIPQVAVQDSLPTQCPVDIQKVFGQQSLFMQRILEQPELALRVRSFTWTMGLHCLCHFPSWEQNSKFEPEKVYALFQSLCNVTTVDIAGGDFHNYPCPSVQNLFPKATHIRLSGQMHYALASAILHGLDKAPLDSLVLENLLERGRLKTGDNFHLQYDATGRRLLVRRPLEEIWPEGGPPVQVSPGAMTRLLGEPLQSRCRHLRRFVFGVLDLTLEARQGWLPPGWCDRTSEIEDELTSFLRSVHPRELTLIYSRLSDRQRESLKAGYGRPRCRRPRRLPVDSRYTLLETVLGGWPGLEKLTLRGGKGFPMELPPSLEGRTALENVQVQWEPDDWVVYQGHIFSLVD